MRIPFAAGTSVSLLYEEGRYHFHIKDFIHRNSEVCDQATQGSYIFLKKKT